MPRFFLKPAIIAARRSRDIHFQSMACQANTTGRIHFTVLEDGTITARVKNRSIRDILFKPRGGKRVSIAQMTRQTQSEARHPCGTDSAHWIKLFL